MVTAQASRHVEARGGRSYRAGAAGDIGEWGSVEMYASEAVATLGEGDGSHTSKLRGRNGFLGARCKVGPRAIR